MDGGDGKGKRKRWRVLRRGGCARLRATHKNSRIGCRSGRYETAGTCAKAGMSCGRKPGDRDPRRVGDRSRRGGRVDVSGEPKIFWVAADDAGFGSAGGRRSGIEARERAGAARGAADEESVSCVCESD